jgi:hypothetical protein
MDIFTETLRSWQNFFFMTGGASATLIGLMFVALSLGMHLINDENRASFDHFASPNIFYFIGVLLLSAIMLMPSSTPPTLAFLLCICSIWGFLRNVPRARRLVAAARKHQDFDFEEWLWQIVAPMLSFTLGFVAALCFVVNQWSIGFMVVAFVDILLLLSGISNTWSLVLWIIEQPR